MVIVSLVGVSCSLATLADEGGAGYADDPRAVGITQELPLVIEPVAAGEQSVRSFSDYTEEVLTAKRSPKSGLAADGNVINIEDANAPAAIQAPNRITDWSSVGYTFWVPPDPSIATGPDHVVVTVNSTYAVYDKGGNELARSNLYAFFLDVMPVVDAVVTPKVVYDPHEGRFIILAAVGDDAAGSWYLIAVSTSDSATGSWIKRALRADLNGGIDTDWWASRPALGFDNAESVYITSNQYRRNNDDSNTFQHAKIRVINKAHLYTAGPVAWYDFWNLDNAGLPAGKAFAIQPCITVSFPGAEWLVSTNSRTAASALTLWAVQDTLQAQWPPSLLKWNIDVAAYDAPPDAAQLGGAELVDTGDCRVQQAVYRVDRILCSFMDAHNWGGGGGLVSAIRLLEIDTPSRSSLQDIRYGADGLYYYCPAVMIDLFGNSFVCFNRSNANQYIGLRYTGKPFLENVWQTSANLKAGEGFYDRKIGSVNVWGNHCGAALDPCDDRSVWVVGAYAEIGNDWGTHVGALSVAEPGQLSVLPVEPLIVSGPPGGPFSPSNKVYSLTNSGVTCIEWTATDDQLWASTFPAGGVVTQLGDADNVTVSVTALANFYGPGVYTGSATFTNVRTDATFNRTIQLRVYTHTPTNTPTNTPTYTPSPTPTDTPVWFNEVHISCAEPLGGTQRIRFALIPKLEDPDCAPISCESPLLECVLECDNCAEQDCPTAVACLIDQILGCINEIVTPFRVVATGVSTIRIEGPVEFDVCVATDEMGLPPAWGLPLLPGCGINNVCNSVAGDELDPHQSGYDFHVIGEPVPIATPRCECAVPPAPGDADNDGVLDGNEFNPDVVVPLVGSNRYLWDSDGDGLADGFEDFNGNGSQDPGELDPRDRDSDGDGAWDGTEVLVLNTSPYNAGDPAAVVDNDGDGLPQPWDPDDANRDVDDDGFTDGYEAVTCGLAAVVDPNVHPPLGDVNCDTFLTNLDALIIQSIQLKLTPHGAVAGEENGDVNRDGSATNLDGLVIQSWFLNLPAAPFIPFPPF